MSRSLLSSALLAVACLYPANAFVPKVPTSNLAMTPTRLADAASNHGNVLDLLDSNFASLFHAEKPLLIDAYAPWCGPCKLIEPIIHKCAQDWSDQLVVSRWNVEGLQTDVKIELLLQGANPTKLPSLILVHKGQAKAIHSGLITEDRLDDLLSQHLPLKTVDVASSNVSNNNNKKTASESKDKSNNKKAGFINFGMDTADDYMLSMMER